MDTNIARLKQALKKASIDGGFNKVNVVNDKKNICVFGLGKYFEDAFVRDDMKKRYHVNFLCDNDCNKWGKEYYGIKVISPTELKNIPNLLVIIMIGNANPIEKQLKKENIEYILVDELFLNTFMDENHEYNWINENSEKIIQAYSLMSDEASKKKYVELLCKRLDENSTENTWEEMYDCKEYFYVNKFSENESYVDCGAFNGDTIEKFIEIVNGRFDNIYAFELDIRNFNELKKVCGRYSGNIECFNVGVADFKTTLEYNIRAEGIGSGIQYNEDMEEKAIGYVEKLDDVLKDRKVTFIKMDIEGSEMSALKGAEELIKINKPKMAVAVYHKISDFWEVPLYLKQLNPEYKFTIKHHSTSMYDTDIYAY
ncbi:MAG: FkbM family methyltransferase [Cellulosilyticaceae bacterium]